MRDAVNQSIPRPAAPISGMQSPSVLDVESSDAARRKRLDVTPTARPCGTYTGSRRTAIRPPQRPIRDINRGPIDVHGPECGGRLSAMNALVVVQAREQH